MLRYFFCFVVTLATLTAKQTYADWQHQMGLHTNYLHRGFGYSNEGRLLTWISEYRHENGLYAGAWLGYGLEQQFLRGEKEIDYWLGFIFNLNPRVAFDISVTEYTYPDDWLVDYDWREVTLSAHVEQRWTASASVSKDRFAPKDTAYSVEVTHRRPINSLLLDSTIGWLTSDSLADELFISHQSSLDDDYWYAELGLSYAIKNFRPRLAWISTNRDNTIVYGQQFANNEWVLSLQYQF